MIDLGRRKTVLCIIASVAELPNRLRPHLIGGGRLELQPSGPIRLLLPPTGRGYVDAQLDDYQGLRRSGFRWTPPMSLSLRARASHPAPPGTLGFGLWNDPFGISLGGSGGVRRFPAAPQAVWFFYGSPPNDFDFGSREASRAAKPDPNRRSEVAVPGGRWRAAVIRSPRLPAWLVAPGAALAFLLSAIPGVRKPAVWAVRKAISGMQRPVAAPLDQWHHYRIDWRHGQVDFAVDGQPVASSPLAPAGRLGFVAWIDNQYAILSEKPGIRFGVLPTQTEAWLEIDDLELNSS